MMWQDGQVAWTPFQLRTVFAQIPSNITSMEILAVAILLVMLMERTLTMDFTVRRSYFSAPLVLLFFAFFFSWWRGCMMKQHVAFVLEFHDIFELPYMFLIISSAFRSEEDRVSLWKVIFYAAIAKSFDGATIYFFSHDSRVRWGVVQSWRDGYMLGITVIGILILLNYRGTLLRPLRKLLLWIAPVLSLCFMMSFRRTFFVGSFVCMMVMFFSLPSGRRKRHFWYVIGILSIALLTVFLTNPLEVATRLSGITAPQNEGSAYIRLMEWPNVIQNILHHPFLGVPIGITWKTYYRMPLSAVYTTLGTHSTYLYWPLRGGIPGTIVFIWIMCKAWKSTLINYRLRKTEEDFVFGQWGIQMLVMYQVACFFGLMYGDSMPGVLSVIFTAFQLQNQKIAGRSSLREVAFRQTMQQGKLVYREPLLRRLYAIVRNRWPLTPILSNG